MTYLLKKIRALAPLAFGALMLLFISGCNLNTRMSTFTAKGPVAETQLDLFMLTVWVTGFIFLLVGGVYIYVVIRFRETKDSTDVLPSQGHGNPLIEIGLIGASLSLIHI